MPNWNVTIELVGNDSETVTTDALDDLLHVLSDLSPVVITPSKDPADGRVRFGVDVTIDAPDAHDAIENARYHFAQALDKAGLPRWPVVRVEALTDEELDHRLQTPMFPKLVGVAEVAEMLGVSKQRVSELGRQESFPRPIISLASGPIWAEPAVAQFIEHWDRRPGRPPAR